MSVPASAPDTRVGMAVGPYLPSRLPPRRPSAYALLRATLRPLFRVYFRLRAEGLDHIPREGAYLIASNHVSMLDWAYLAYFLPRSVRFVVDREMLRHLPIRVGCRINGSVAIRTDRPDRNGIRAARVVLAAGLPLVIFPEGQISLTGEPQAGHPGVISLARLAGVPIIPVALRGAFQAFPRRRRVPRPRLVTVSFGPALRVPSEPLGRAAQQVLTQRLMTSIADLLRAPASDGTDGDR